MASPDPDDIAEQRARLAIIESTNHTRKLFKSAADLELAARETRKMAEAFAGADAEMIAEYRKQYGRPSQRQA